ncbi:hypothetical protein GC173_02965 [bacterium]|nr:hypothetical protein [bacterium]
MAEPNASNTNRIASPRLVALDSSHWAKLIAAATGRDMAVRREANRFPTALLEKGYCILFSFDHLQELMAVDNDDRVSERLDFIRRIPFLSWTGLENAEFKLGGIVDILASEALAAYRNGGEAASVRATARSLLVRHGSGTDIIMDDPLFAKLFGEWSRNSADRARTIAGIVPVQFLSPKTKIGALLSGKLRSSAATKKIVAQMQTVLTAELRARGDRRIENADERARAFMSDVLNLRSQLPIDARGLVLKGLKLQGIDEEEINPDMTLGELGELGIFREQLRIIAPILGVPFDRLKKSVRAEQLPSRIIRSRLTEVSQQLPERKGSDLNDSHLAALAPYADILYVDKRTAENFRRAFQKYPGLKELTGQVRKASDWRAIYEAL